jgi:hypothetical protein
MVVLRHERTGVRCETPATLRCPVFPDAYRGTLVPRQPG